MEYRDYRRTYMGSLYLELLKAILGVAWGHGQNFKIQIFQVIFYSYAVSADTLFCRQLAVVPMAMEVCRGVLDI